jgi:hypothetical protein
MVYESWEGSHNVLVAQVLNDLRRLPILDSVADWLTGVVDTVGDADLAAVLSAELDRLLASARQCVDDPVVGAWHFREVVDRIGVLAEAALLAGAGEDALARHLLPGRVGTGGSPAQDAARAARVDAVLDAMG